MEKNKVEIAYIIAVKVKEYANPFDSIVLPEIRAEIIQEEVHTNIFNAFISDCSFFGTFSSAKLSDKGEAIFINVPLIKKARTTNIGFLMYVKIRINGILIP